MSVGKKKAGYSEASNRLGVMKVGGCFDKSETVEFLEVKSMGSVLTCEGTSGQTVLFSHSNDDHLEGEKGACLSLLRK